MKKLFLFVTVLLLISGCGEDSKFLTCTSSDTSGNITTNTKYEIEYEDDDVKFVTITYDYNKNDNSADMDGVNADTDGTTDDKDDKKSDEVIDGVVGDTADTVIDGVTDTILDMAGIKNNFENQMSSYDNIDGFSYKVDTDSDDEYKIIYKLDFDKISDSDLTRFNVDRDFSTIKSNYQDLGYTCK